VEREHLELIFVSDGDAQDQARMVERLDLKDFASSIALRLACGWELANCLCLLIDQQGVVAGAGLVNSASTWRA